MILEEIDDEKGERKITCTELSLTSKRLRDVVARDVFKTVRFSNDKRISDSALAAATKYGHYIQKLEFVGFDPAAEDAPPEVRAGRNHTLPPSAISLFEAPRDLLPNLQTFVISFDHNFGYSLGQRNNKRDGVGFFDTIETSLRITSKEEAMTPRRALWANTYRHLASNTTVSHLVIQNWPPRAVSVFATDSWKEHLGRLHIFEISVAGYKDPSSASYQPVWSNTCPGYQRAIEKMGEYFFDHLASAKTVKISAPTGFPIGSPVGSLYEIERGYVQGILREYFFLPLREKSMPAVEHLELSGFFISHDLAKWIIEHSRTLRKLVLTNAQSMAFHMIHQAPLMTLVYTWMEFFDALSAVKDLALAQFEMTSYCRIERPWSGTFTDWVDPSDPKCNPANEKSESFGYAHLGRDGNLQYLTVPSPNQHKKGADLAAYKRFMRKVGAAGKKQ